MPTANQNTPAEIQREVRFAVVIYGGVSLAIYINGVAQELLNMVRSTSGKIPFDELKGSEKVYYELATMVGDSAIVPTRERLDEPGKVGLTEETIEGDGQGIPRTKFVVDILSGTSAGGINAIYLAKALTRGTTLNDLAKMWIVEADMTKLLNDKGVKPKYLWQKPVPSLLNSPWMYLKLLEALQKMNTEVPLGSMVDDLDLYCTATDLAGLPITLPLTDKGVKERRYKSDFWFRRRGPAAETPDRDDLVQNMDPFLAFVARCTSSFPVAFEPMTLEDIVDTLKRGKNDRFKDYFRKDESAPQDGQGKIFNDPTDAAQLAGAVGFEATCRIYGSQAARDQVPFNRRAFGDGGYLHNKPFNYAIETLKQRSAIVSVDRKLIYIEPEPESFSSTDDTLERDGKGVPIRPNVLQNSMYALLTLPRYQTIQEDIDSVVKWNSDIARLQQVIDDIDRNVENPKIDRGFNGNRSYRQLRIAGASDRLAGRIVDSMNMPLSSSEGTAIRMVVSEWRERTYKGRDEDEVFLQIFDVDFCQRALRYLRTQIQKRNSNDKELLGRLAIQQRRFEKFANKEVVLDLEDAIAYRSWLALLKFIVNPAAAALVLSPKDPQAPILLSATDAGCKARVKWVFDHSDPPLGFILDPQIASSACDACGANTLPDGFLNETAAGAKQRLDWWKANQAALANFLAPMTFEKISEVVVSEFMNAYNNPKEGIKLDIIIESLKSELFSALGDGSWVRFEIQDSLVYPIIFGTSLGEFETVDIFRISPRDTAPLLNTSPSRTSNHNPPLKGASLDAFGAFLDESWRLSDMLRGRLDGAERLITAVLPDSDPRTINFREKMVKKAQEAIAEDWTDFQAKLNLLE